MNRILTIFGLAVLSLPVWSQTISDIPSGATPWTRFPEVSGGKYRFVILADRNGGERLGVFDGAIGLINKEKPDFIVSTGDLIDGYTTDSTYLAAMWQRLTGSIDRFAAPLFHLPGNHDISNVMLRAEWIRRFGCTDYSFRIGSDLFVVLDSEEFVGRGGISGTQAARYAAEISRMPAEARIFVFMHRPLWETPSPYDSVHDALKNRKAYVFCGHEHRYLSLVRDGIPYYMLATLGGDSRMRGAELGEFDHYMVVEVDAERVAIRNRPIDGGEVPLDIVNSGNVAAVDALRGGQWLKAQPVVVPSRCSGELRLRMVFQNPHTTPLTINGMLPAGCTPAQVRHEVAAGMSDTIPVVFSAQGSDLENYTIPEITLTGSYTAEGRAISAPAQVRFRLDYIRVCGGSPSEIRVIDPFYIRESWDWHGVQDGSFAFTVEADHRVIRIVIRTTDDRLVTNPVSEALQDKLFVEYAPGGSQPLRWTLAPGGAVGGSLPDGAAATCLCEGNSLVAVVAIPRPTGADMFRLNVGFMDHDNPLNTKPSVLWWRYPFGSAADYPEAGKFIFK